jgi:hypothetical protein
VRIQLGVDPDPDVTVKAWERILLPGGRVRVEGTARREIDQERGSYREIATRIVLRAARLVAE